MFFFVLCVCAFLCVCMHVHPERRSRAEHGSSKVNGDLHSAASHAHAALANGYICNDCSIHSDRKKVLTTHTTTSSSTSSAQAAASAAAALSSSSSSSSTIYSWDKSRRNKTGETRPRLHQPGAQTVTLRSFPILPNVTASLKLLATKTLMAVFVETST